MTDFADYQDKPIRESVTKATLRLMGAAAGTIAALHASGPDAAMVMAGVSSLVEDVARSWLAPRELSRMEKVLQHASARFQELHNSGTSMRSDISEAGLEELFEGMLLKARNTYEEKKLPFIGNLFATACFTNTPLINSNQTLINAERLSYRHLCIISVLAPHTWEVNPAGLSPLSYQEERNKQFDERAAGVYEDVYYLISQGLVGQMDGARQQILPVLGVQAVVPALLFLQYPARLMNNGMVLREIPDEEKQEIIQALSPATDLSSTP